MESEKLMSQEDLDSLVNQVWKRSQEQILKQVEYSVATELSDRARSRSRSLIVHEVDAILKPKIESMKVAMEERANRLTATLLPKLEKALMEGLSEAIRGMSSYTVHQILAQAENNIQAAMLKTLEPEKVETT